MPATFLFTAAAAMALLPAGAVLFVVLDRYAAPRVPKNLFDDRKVFLLVPIGIPLGIVLALVLVAYFAALSSASRSGDISGPSLYLLLFLFIAALLRRVLVRIKTFGGSSKKDPQVTIHTFAYGTMSGAGTALGFSIWQLDVPHPPLQAIPILLGFSVDLVLLEAWAGLRFGRAMCSRFSWLPPLRVMAGEALGLLALSPIFVGDAYLGYAGLAVLFIGLMLMMSREEPRALGPLRRILEGEKQQREGRFGRSARTLDRPKDEDEASEDPVEGSPIASERTS